MLQLILHLIRGRLRSRDSLILGNLALRHQLQALGRSRGRSPLKNHFHEIRGGVSVGYGPAYFLCDGGRRHRYFREAA